MGDVDYCFEGGAEGYCCFSETCQGKACCGDDSVWKDGKCGGGDCEDDGKKDGQCPRPEGYGVCWEQCSSNDDCSGNQLCCSNGCGHVCIDPASGGNGSEGYR